MPIAKRIIWVMIGAALCLALPGQQVDLQGQ